MVVDLGGGCLLPEANAGCPSGKHLGIPVIIRLVSRRHEVPRWYIFLLIGCAYDEQYAGDHKKSPLHRRDIVPPHSTPRSGGAHCNSFVNSQINVADLLILARL